MEVIAVRTKADTSGEEYEMVYDTDDITEFNVSHEFVEVPESADAPYFHKEPTGVSNLNIKFKSGKPPLWRKVRKFVTRLPGLPVRENIHLSDELPLMPGGLWVCYHPGEGWQYLHKHDQAINWMQNNWAEGRMWHVAISDLVEVYLVPAAEAHLIPKPENT